jgi:hypothetical protein
MRIDFRQYADPDVVLKVQGALLEVLHVMRRLRKLELREIYSPGGEIRLPHSREAVYNIALKCPSLEYIGIFRSSVPLLRLLLSQCFF